jgi:hypothetical protein
MEGEFGSCISKTWTRARQFVDDPGRYGSSAQHDNPAVAGSFRDEGVNEKYVLNTNDVMID